MSVIDLSEYKKKMQNTGQPDKERGRHLNLDQPPPKKKPLPFNSFRYELRKRLGLPYSD